MLTIYTPGQTEKYWSVALELGNKCIHISAVDSISGKKICNLAFLSYTGLAAAGSARELLAGAGYSTTDVAWNNTGDLHIAKG